MKIRALSRSGVSRSVTGCLVAGLIVTGLVVAAPPASAAGQRYAAPTGTDAQDCLTPATACSITKAVNQAVAGDQVVVAPGSYTVSVSLQSTVGITVLGTAGQPRPVLTTSASTGLRLIGNGSRAADLTIVHTGSGRGLDMFSSEMIERVSVRSSDTTAPDTLLTKKPKKPKKRTFSHRAKFVFASTVPGSTFTCRLDEKRAKPCTSPFKKRVKKLGKHKFRVWATDAAGNTDPKPATYTWTIKRKPR